MALDEAPPFWWEPPGWQAWLLSPVSLIYGKLAARRMNHTPAASVPVPVICVGNFIVGGAGKTPTVELLAKAAEKRGMQPGHLKSRSRRRDFQGNACGTKPAQCNGCRRRGSATYPP